MEKQLLTEEQLDIFAEHFDVVEIVRETTTYVATLDLNELNKCEPDEQTDHFFVASEWEQQSSEVTSSDGYKIVRKQDDKTVKEVFDVPDVVKFILHEMDTYI
jgi:hypothetical protein